MGNRWAIVWLLVGALPRADAVVRIAVGQEPARGPEPVGEL